MVTDPPYNVNYKGGTNKKRNNIKNDNMKPDQFKTFLKKTFATAFKTIKPGGAFYVWHSDSERINFQSALKDNGFRISQNLIWVKNQIVLNWNDYKNQYEPCLYGWKPGATHYFVNKFDQKTVVDDFQKIDKMKKEELIKALKLILDNDQNDIIRVNKPSKSPEHPTMKPVPLFGRQILNSSKKGEIIFDLFGGSGTTIIAAEQCGRKARVIELEPHYCDVIIARWEALTGEKAKRIK